MAVVLRRDGGSVTVEAAIGLSALTAVFGLLLAGVGAAGDQVRCTDAAREAARLLARGEPALAEDAVRRIAPAGARLEVHREGDAFTAEIRADPAVGLLPGLHLQARAYAVAEPGTEAGRAG
ncbi:TadE family type IV pilus minor pilin [Amycolatopsis sp. H20-H5]|uniref:TadE family type IV pilus minor pilin n=1 Tax=Amycolatopsis sp. H20-H5 TaxID=3046309 RepID=UPI002DB6E1F0|nr:TadE family type IV pilus minor pilin [Amycolatopsis sp. H20-H5]MEC3979540.1 TadE family type IV pilus minor pilin [Amycolatopsis sp. H20-H5]